MRSPKCTFRRLPMHRQSHVCPHAMPRRIKMTWQWGSITLLIRHWKQFGRVSRLLYDSRPGQSASPPVHRWPTDRLALFQRLLAPRILSPLCLLISPHNNLRRRVCAEVGG